LEFPTFLLVGAFGLPVVRRLLVPVLVLVFAAEAELFADVEVVAVIDVVPPCPAPSDLI
jgi:uncharacterized membrane protein SpoIIM required for sporulation